MPQDKCSVHTHTLAEQLIVLINGGEEREHRALLVNSRGVLRPALARWRRVKTLVGDRDVVQLWLDADNSSGIGERIDLYIVPCTRGCTYEDFIKLPRRKRRRR